MTSLEFVEFSPNANVSRVAFNRLLDHEGVHAQSHLSTAVVDGEAISHREKHLVVTCSVGYQ